MASVEGNEPAEVTGRVIYQTRVKQPPRYVVMFQKETRRKHGSEVPPYYVWVRLRDHRFYAMARLDVFIQEVNDDLLYRIIDTRTKGKDNLVVDETSPENEVLHG